MTRNSAVTVEKASGSLTIKAARIVFEPTEYDGSESSRVNLVLEAGGEECNVIRQWEDTTDGNTALCRAITPNGLKVNINKGTVHCWEDKKRVRLPGNLKDKACNAPIQWTGAWTTTVQGGLCLKVTGVETMEQEIEYPFGQYEGPGHTHTGTGSNGS